MLRGENGVIVFLHLRLTLGAILMRLDDTELWLQFTGLVNRELHVIGGMPSCINIPTMESGHSNHRGSCVEPAEERTVHARFYTVICLFPVNDRLTSCCFALTKNDGG